MVLRRDILTKLISSGGHTANYSGRNDRIETAESADTGSDDTASSDSIDWLLAQDTPASTNKGENPEYLFTEIEEGEEQETRDFDYTAMYRTIPDSGEQQTTEGRGEMLARMNEAILTINYRKVPLTHFFPDEEPLKKEVKQGVPLLEATRIDQAILDMDAFL